MEDGATEESISIDDEILDTGSGQDVLFAGGFRLPDYLYDKLFDYQQTGFLVFPNYLKYYLFKILFR